MSMGDSAISKFEVKGRMITNRTPSKLLNPYIKAQLLATLKRGDIVIETKRAPGSDTYYIKDQTDKKLFSFDCAWDYGYYNITLGGSGMTVAEMDWFENDGHTNKEQQDIFDVLNAINAKQKELHEIQLGWQRLTPQERVALSVLDPKQK